MASEDRAPDEPLNWIAALAAAPYASDFHQAMRRLELAFRHLPRWGEAARPRDEAVRLGQDASLAFAPSAVAGFERGDAERPAKLSVTFMGLFGPNGPLPVHITEYVRERVRHAGDETFAAFANLFHHRILVLFHRAWAQSRPAVSRDRPGVDRYLGYVGAIAGLGLPSLIGDDPAMDQARLQFAGFLSADAKHPDGMRAIIEGYFQLPVRIREFVGDWLTLPPDERFRLGFSRRVSALGVSTVLGDRVFSRSHKFRVVLGPLKEQEFWRFLPHGPGLFKLTELVRTYVGNEFDWDVELIPAVGTATQLRLGQAGRLGFNGMLGAGARPVGRAHVLVNPFTHQTERVLA